MDFSVDLSFVEEDRLRELLESYLRQAAAAYDAHAYLGTLVACGAVSEGLLTWALFRCEEAALSSPGAQKDKQGAALPIDRWNLSNLIDVAGRIGLLGRTAKDASWAVKEFRNFVHPYNVIKRSARPDQALASSALAAVSEMTRSLQGRLTS